MVRLFEEGNVGMLELSLARLIADDGVRSDPFGVFRLEFTNGLRS